MNKNNKNIDFKVAATLFLHSEYILRHIEQNIYSIPNIELLKKIITNNPEHQTVFDFLITAIFLKFHKKIHAYNDIILKSLNLSTLLDSNFLCRNICFSFLLFNILDKQYKKIKDKNLIYDYAHKYLEDSKFRFALNTLVTISVCYGVYANHIFTFKNKDYSTIEHNHVSIFKNISPLMPPTNNILIKNLPTYMHIDGQDKGISFTKPKITINLNSNKYSFYEASKHLQYISNLLHFNELFTCEKPHELMSPEMIEFLYDAKLDRLSSDEFNNRIIGLLLWDKIKKDNVKIKDAFFDLKILPKYKEIKNINCKQYHNQNCFAWEDKCLPNIRKTYNITMKSIDQCTICTNHKQSKEIHEETFTWQPNTRFETMIKNING